MMSKQIKRIVILGLALLCSLGLLVGCGENARQDVMKPEDIVDTRQPIDEELTGYPIGSLHLVMTEEKEHFTVELRFSSLQDTPCDTSSGKLVYSSASGLVGMTLYTDDFEQPHELYDAVFDPENWQIQSLLKEKYSGGQVEEEPATVYDEDSLAQLTMELFSIMEQEMKARGKTLA